MEEYRGYIKINGIDYHIIFDNFILRIFAGKDKNLKMKHIASIAENGVLHLTDLLLPNNDIFVFVDKYKIGYVGAENNEFRVHAIGFVSRNRYDEDFSLEKIPVSPCLKIDSIFFRHPILDCFFSDDELLLHRCIEALNRYDDELHITMDVAKRDAFNVLIDGKTYNFEFGVAPEFNYYEKPMPYAVFNYLKINIKEGIYLNESIVNEDNEGIVINKLIKITRIVKLFLSFVSQSRIVNLEPVFINTGQSFPYYEGILYLRPDGNETFRKGHILSYEDVKLGVSKILHLISDNQICFRSLLNVEYDKIQLCDIINVCAAFEAQFKLTNRKFKDDAQKAVRNKMHEQLKASRETYPVNELDYFDKILKHLKSYNDVMLQRLEVALAEFVEIYGDFGVKNFFKADYEKMPKRIKDARDALAHGSNAHQIKEAALTDVQLLRAITYMLILQYADIEKEALKSCLSKFCNTSFMF